MISLKWYWCKMVSSLGPITVASLIGGKLWPSPRRLGEFNRAYQSLGSENVEGL